MSAAGYTVESAGDIALVAATAKTILSVINAANGVIVMGEKVRIGKVAVSYRTARVTVGAAAGMPPAAAASNAARAPDVFVIGETTTVDDFVAALKAVGLKADGIIGVLQAVEKAGALFGSLVVM